MHIRFTKMQGAGNDFVVLDETAAPLGLSTAQYRWLADRHFGVGADQILSVRPAPNADADFGYVIHNSDGHEVENCGNGARCFVRYVRERGLTDKTRVRAQLRHGVIDLAEQPDGRVAVDMGAPIFDLAAVPFDAAGRPPVPHGGWRLWPLDLKPKTATVGMDTVPKAMINVAILSMGNPHAVALVEDVDAAPVAALGPLIEHHPAFPQRVNAGFMQVVDRGHVRLRVHERGAGETLACGTGACAAVVAGIRLGLLDPCVQVQARGGLLTIEWASGDADPVRMTGPAATVFEGSIDVPANP
ncbi:diaminopimelate epimerase [Ottowia sp.]|jgi:diaminopimelate epimerase|uniref:diaminopimelate epimerase n=1 Tax=Ottowia sp. TaxID=1898956 RepID=UPI0025F434A9|nr:diaminopimelate epimerase [Ottowia sp.]MBK6614536.1 diaminopimelate epimerase [Ottowia sp.]MBK6747240.1 diaminopimelate epimerase [Ottowia sp.]